jgi:hypothetical protein
MDQPDKDCLPDPSIRYRRLIRLADFLPEVPKAPDIDWMRRWLWGYSRLLGYIVRDRRAASGRLLLQSTPFMVYYLLLSSNVS